MLRILNELQKEKYAHEDKAKNKIFAQLKNSEIKKLFKQGGFGKEHRIVVFGRSHVGKTTLILKLLGAKSIEDDEIYNLTALAKHIRGNTKKGGAGTATVFRYRISDTNQGKIIYPNKKVKVYSELDELEKILHNIRKKVESGKWVDTEPVINELPNIYFINKSDTPWVITDIPGINSKEKKEHYHVSDLVKAYIMQCNVLLVLSPADNIAQLKSLNIPDFGSWSFFGRRCRLIITYAMQPNSIREAFKKSGKLSAERLIRYYKDELIKDNIDIKHLNAVYPFDYGETWERLKLSEPELFDNVKDAMFEMEQYLRDSLSNSMKAEEEFKALIDLSNLNTILNKKKNKLENILHSLNERIEEIRMKHNSSNKKIEELNAEIENIEKDIETIKNKLESKFSNPWSNWHHNEEDYLKNEPRDHDILWDNAKADLLFVIDKFSSNIYGSRNLKYIYNLLRDEAEYFPPFRNSWRDFAQSYKNWDEDYNHTWLGNSGKINPFSNFTSKNERRTEAKWSHAKAIRDGIETLFLFWSREVDKCVKNDLNRKINNLKQDKKSLYNRIEFYKRESQHFKNLLDKYTKKKNHLETELDSLKKSMTHDLALFATQYPCLREQELKKRVDYLVNKSQKSSSAIESIQYLAHAHQVINISKTISE